MRRVWENSLSYGRGSSLVYCRIIFSNDETVIVNRLHAFPRVPRVNAMAMTAGGIQKRVSKRVIAPVLFYAFLAYSTFTYCTYCIVTYGDADNLRHTTAEF